jgi:hypothetical protein
LGDGRGFTKSPVLQGGLSLPSFLKWKEETFPAVFGNSGNRCGCPTELLLIDENTAWKS